MTKEKQIEEMANNLENHTCMSQFQAEIAARVLYTIGYRRASEVAEEIFAEIEKLKHTKWDWTDVVDWDAIAELKKKYTEEGK